MVQMSEFGSLSKRFDKFYIVHLLYLTEYDTFQPFVFVIEFFFNR